MIATSSNKSQSVLITCALYHRFFNMINLINMIKIKKIHPVLHLSKNNLDISNHRYNTRNTALY